MEEHGRALAPPTVICVESQSSFPGTHALSNFSACLFISDV